MRLLRYGRHPGPSVYNPGLCQFGPSPPVSSARVGTIIQPWSSPSISFPIMFDFTTLALTFICGFLASLAIRFLFQRFNFDRRWQRPSSLTMKPTLLDYGDSKIAPINNLFPHAGNLLPVIPQGPPTHFGPMMQPPFGPIPPNLGPMSPQPGNQYSGESFGKFRKVHQQLNRMNMWEACQPEPPNNLSFAFTVYYQHKPRHCVPSIQIMVEVHCEGLKEVLKNCLKNVDSIFDPTPMV